MVIEVDFTPVFREKTYQSIKLYGLKRTYTWMLESGLHESFVVCILRQIISTRGW